AGVADVGGGQGEDDLVDVLVLGRELADLVVVPRALGEGRGEDRRVRGHPDHVVVLGELGEVAGLDALPREVVEPDRDAGLGELLQVVRHVLPPGRDSMTGGRVGQPVAMRMLSSAALATASAVMPNSW